MTLTDAMIIAQAESDDSHATQHVNRRLDGSYYISDWYNCDSTVVTYYNGHMTFMHGWLNSQIEFITAIRKRDALIA